MNHKSKKVIQTVPFLTVCISIVSVSLTCILLFSNGLSVIKEIGIIRFLFGEVQCPFSNEFGILPMIVGLLYVTLGALAIGVSVGILTAVFMAYFCSSKLYKPLKAGINLMAGIPSVVHGFFGLVVSVPFVRDYTGGYGMGVLTAATLLGIMILPTIVSVSETVIHAVPHHYYEGGLALGASHERSISSVVLSTAKRDLLAVIVLGLGRAVGETMAVIMVAGNQVILSKVLTLGVKTLTTSIIMEMSYSAGLHRKALTDTAVILFIFIFATSICFSLLYKEEQGVWKILTKER